MNILFAVEERNYGTIITDEFKEKLESLGNVTCLENREEKVMGKEYSDILNKNNIEIIVTSWGSPKLTKEIYDENPQIKYLCNLTGAVRQYVEKEVIEAGVVVSNWGGFVGKSVAEAALLLTLGVLRRSTYHQIEMHIRGGFGGGGGLSEGLFRQRVGLQGLGVIAQDFVRLIKPFDCRVSAYSPHCPDKVFKELGVKRVDTLDELFSTNRIISIHASKIASNHHLVNKEMIARLEDGGVIVNTARADVMDTEALIAELKTGRISAGLDVYEVEPLEKDSGLRGLENCMLHPHNGGPTHDWYPEMAMLGVKNVEAYINGKDVVYTVSPEKYDLIT